MAPQQEYNEVICDEDGESVQNSTNGDGFQDEYIESETSLPPQSNETKKRSNTRLCRLFRTHGLNDYLDRSSGRLLELTACAIFFIVCNTIFLVDGWFPLNMRPIPVELWQAEEDANDLGGRFVKNLVFAEDYNGETIPGNLHKWLLHIPVLVQLLLVLLVPRCRPDLHRTLCTYAIGTGLNHAVTDSLKLYVGYLRPVFLDLCDPVEDYSSCQNSSEGIRKSFPSSHSSTSFCVATLLALFLHHRLGIHSERRYICVCAGSKKNKDCNDDDDDRNGNDKHVFVATYPTSGFSILRARLVSLVSLLPIGLALYVACSRIVDNMHFPADVIAGSLIGTFTAYFAHGLWFAL